MKQEVSFDMKKMVFKFLTFFAFFLVIITTNANVNFSVENFKSHLRWNVLSTKGNFWVKKDNQNLQIRSLDIKFLEQLSANLKENLNQKYIKSYSYVKSAEGDYITIVLQGNVEIFNFYRDREKKHIVDFWLEESDALLTSKDKVTSSDEIVPLLKKTNKKVVKSKRLIRNKLTKSKKVNKTKKNSRKKPKVKNLQLSKAVLGTKEYRDFRYGAAFIWDYEPLSPSPQRMIDINRKTPEYFYPIKDKKVGKDSNRDAHFQLAINMFKKKKWGLMYKALKMYQEKYGDEDRVDEIEYLKANAILKENLQKGQTQPSKMALTMLKTVGERSSDYELKKAVTRYLLQTAIDGKEYVEGLYLAKKYYVSSRENFDYESSPEAIEMILFCLASLNQTDKVTRLLKDKLIKKLIPLQTMLAYQFYADARLDNTDTIIELYKQHEKKFQAGTHESILFNTAEAYFKNADYKKAIQLFDQFVAQYSYHDYAAHSRLRLALSYDLTGQAEKKVAALYRDTIDRSTNFDISYEAKLRYVGLRSVRKYKQNDLDKEVRVFLNLKNDQKKNINKDLKRLLWLVRLRTYIVDKNYTEGLAYLRSIPFNTIKPVEKRVFQGDGAEII